MMNLNTKVTSKRVVSAFVIGAIFVGLNATWALWGFWRTLDNIVGSAPTSEYQYGYWYGDYGFGYGYWYGENAKYWYGNYISATLPIGNLTHSGTTNWTNVSLTSGTTVTTSDWKAYSSITTESTTWGSRALKIVARDSNGVEVNTDLLFSKPVLLDFGLSGQNITVTVKHNSLNSGNIGYYWLTTDANATCLNWAATPAYAGWTITTWMIYTCSASTFTATVATTTTSSSWGGGGGWSSTHTCADSELICKETSGTYKLFRKDWVSCVNGNLGKTCEIIDNGTWTTDDSSDNTDSSDTNTSGFTDINNSFAKDYINKLKDLWVVNGRDSEWKIFAPKSNTTRSEFLKMTLKLFGKDYSTTDVSSLTFSDVSKTSWQAKVVAKAVSEGIVSTANSKFRPNDSISRAEAVKILLKVAWIEASEVSTSSFSDVSGWATKYVEQAKKSGIVNGQTVNGKLMFRPSDSITREEVAKVIVKTNDL